MLPGNRSDRLTGGVSAEEITTGTQRLAGRTALVTGATAGIGEAIARRLAADGAHVWVTGRDVASAESVAASISADGGAATAARLDVTDPAAVATVVGAVVTAHGALDVLVANAALAGERAYLGPLLDVTDEQWRAVIDVNLTGVFTCAREAARVMAPRRSGVILTVNSVNGFVPEADVPAYAASKGGVLMLTKSLARDLGPLGIRVNGIAPGGTDTERMRRLIDDRGLDRGAMEAATPLRRRADPAEVAAVAAFLVSDEASYVTGETVVVDGGLLCT